MPDTTLHMHRLTSVAVAPYLGPGRPGPFAVVRLDEGVADTRLHVTPDGLSRAREVASALNAAADAVEDAVRRSRAIDIRLLAPTVVEETFLDRVTRWGGTEAPEDEPRPAA